MIRRPGVLTEKEKERAERKLRRRFRPLEKINEDLERTIKKGEKKP